jgi:hypothetical protein
MSRRSRKILAEVIPTEIPTVSATAAPPAPPAALTSAKCQRCDREVLGVIDRGSSWTWVHEQGEKPAQVYGCTVSTRTRS